MSPASAPPLTGDAAIAKFRELLPAFRSAMLVTHTMDGADPHARPMGLVGDPAAFGGALWFFSDDRSRKIAEIARQPRASLVLQSDREPPTCTSSGGPPSSTTARACGSSTRRSCGPGSPTASTIRTSR